MVLTAPPEPQRLHHHRLTRQLYLAEAACRLQGAERDRDGRLQASMSKEEYLKMMLPDSPPGEDGCRKRHQIPQTLTDHLKPHITPPLRVGIPYTPSYSREKLQHRILPRILSSSAQDQVSECSGCPLSTFLPASLLLRRLAISSSQRRASTGQSQELVQHLLRLLSTTQWCWGSGLWGGQSIVLRAPAASVLDVWVSLSQ
ncbi:hypothetical protein NFI96_003428 [Prochilodus magdalenae]|nr:hypothetical protein NFI96_003428 [Prochilodus magdalenae]